MDRTFHATERLTPEKEVFPMHAVVGVFDMDRALFAEQEQHLKERIVPMVRQSPGFVAGYWSYDHAAAKSHSFIVLESEAVAVRFCEMVRKNVGEQNANGVKVESLTTVEVLADAKK
jgi:hypothetical protein